MPDLETIRLGSFQMDSGIAVLSDPCYDQTCWCQIRDIAVKRGPWNAWVKKGPESEPFCPGGRLWDRCYQLIAIHRDAVMSNPDSITIDEPIDGSVGVDSGKAGIYDMAHYKDDSVVPADAELRGRGRDEEPWYSLNCATSHRDLPNLNYAEERAAYDRNEEEIIRRIRAGEVFSNLCHMDCPCRTIEDLHAGVIPFGCVSSAGYGDGGYQAYCHRTRDGEINALKIVFIGDEEGEFEDTAPVDNKETYE